MLHTNPNTTTTATAEATAAQYDGSAGGDAGLALRSRRARRIAQRAASQSSVVVVAVVAAGSPTASQQAATPKYLTFDNQIYLYIPPAFLPGVFRAVIDMMAPVTV